MYRRDSCFVVPVMMDYAVPDPNSAPPEAAGHCGGVRAPPWVRVREATSQVVSTTREYPDDSEQDPNLNDICAASSSELSA